MKRLAIAGATAVAAVACVAVLVAGQSPGRATLPLPATVDTCGLGMSPHVDVIDHGDTMTIHGDGNDDPGLHVESIGCLLAGVGTPGSVVEQMSRTRALDGTQSATWDGLSASWTYHPDNGLNVIVTREPS